MIERRRFIRIPNLSEIKYSLSGSPKTYSSVFHNISPEGACFLAREFIPVGSTVKLSFVYEKYSYGGLTKIIWIKQESESKYKVGVKFIDGFKLPDNLIGPEELRRLKSALKIEREE